MAESSQIRSRARQKIASRKQDEKLVADGKMTVEEIAKKNSMFSGNFVQELAEKEFRNAFFS